MADMVAAIKNEEWMRAEVVPLLKVGRDKGQSAEQILAIIVGAVICTCAGELEKATHLRKQQEGGGISHFGNEQGENTYGLNAFREVLVQCAGCGGKKTTNMQCLTGPYLWWCDLCGEKTHHNVTETSPRKKS